MMREIRDYRKQRADNCLDIARWFRNRGDADMTMFSLYRAARYARSVIDTVNSYCPAEYPTIGWYYEHREEIVDIMQSMGRP
jgi:hypothetical protein